MDTNTTVADQNTERLIQAAYEPDPAPPAFAVQLEGKLIAEAKVFAKQTVLPQPATRRRRSWRWGAVALGGLAACILIVYAIFSKSEKPREETPKPGDVVKSKPIKNQQPAPTVNFAKWTDDVRNGMAPRKRPDAPPLTIVKTGEKLTTKSAQTRLVQLADGTRLYANAKTEVEITGPRQLTLHKGQIYLEVAPLESGPRFVVKTANREMTATGTHFAVQADPVASGVVVTQGKVAVQGIEKEVAAGQQVAAGKSAISVAPRASHTLAWTRELMAAAESPMVPAARHAGGALVAVDPQGQEIKLALRQYHVDVHIEDGFARTTIDQTYFNTTWERLEGTFYFPLPADASLSRLAMYVVDGNQCKLMEGGMAERKHAADVYETIRYQRRDPALLEWLDGSTFKMRVFPLEAKQEKRIILSYTQKLPSLYGTARYRFAGGLNMPVVREWSFNARIKSGSGMNVWSPNQADAIITPQGGDTLVQHYANNVKPASDVAIEMQDKNASADVDVPRFASFLHEGNQYLMVRYRPTLPSLPERQRRDWIVLFESSASRDPLVAGTQVDVVRNLLRNAEYDDTFTLLTVNSKVQAFNEKPLAARPKNVDAAIKALQETHLVGALDLQQALQAAVKLAKDAKNPHIVHIGGGLPAIGERDAGNLARLLPESVRYVGVGVGKRWNRAFMKAAAERTNGLFTQINPDEVIAWRAFELLATLNTPRLLNLQVAGGAPFLMETSMLAQGEELCAITRVDTAKSSVPAKVTIKGRFAPLAPVLGGEGLGVRGDKAGAAPSPPAPLPLSTGGEGRKSSTFAKEFPVVNVFPGAGYLPRTWAKLEIDRLLADNSAKHKDAIIALSKAMYVMSPYTSLLVLETDADYEKFKVDKGRKDHWAMYGCPPKIPLVYEPDGKPPVKDEVKKPKSDKPACDEVLGTIVAMTQPNGGVAQEVRAMLVPELESLRVDDQSRAHVGEVIIDGNPVDVNQDRVVRRMLQGVQAGEFLPAGDEPAIHFPPLATWQAITRLRKVKYSTDDLTELEVLGDVKVKDKRRNKLSTARDGELTEESLRMLRRQRLFYELEDREQKREDVFGRVSTLTDRLGRPHARQQSEVIKSIDQLLVDEKKLAPRIDPDMPRLPSLGVVGGKPRWEESRIEEGFGDSIEFFPPLGFVRGTSRVHTSIAGRKNGLLKRIDPIDLFNTTARPPGMPAPDRNETAAGSASVSLRYERPPLEYNSKLFTNLVQYAPGMHGTWADILATLDAEADVEQPKLGGIEPAARRLIDRARAAGWQTLTIPAAGPIPACKIHFNGAGQFAYERMLVSGLREEVVCDGKTLWHLYPEIGLGARRPFSRHHHPIAAGINPAFLPAAEELARGFNLKLVDGATVALVPLWVGELKKDEKYHRVHLVFAKDTRLSERRIVEMPAGKTLVRQVFHADGSIEWHGADGKSLAKQTRLVAPGNAPSLVPSVGDLVVIAMPLRMAPHWEQQRKDGMSASVLADIDAQVLASFCANPKHQFGKGFGANIHFGATLHLKGRGKLGYHTLLNASGFCLAKEEVWLTLEKKDWSINLEKTHPNSALAAFLTQGQRDLANGGNEELLKKLPGPTDGFIQRLGRFRKIWWTWHNQRVSPADTPAEMAKVIEFLNDTPAPTFAYAVLDTMQRRSSAPTEHMFDIAVKRFGPISDPLGLGYVFRYEHARSFWQAGQAAEAGKRFKELHAATLKLGLLPPIDSAFRDVLQTPGASDVTFIGYTRKTLDGLLAEKRYGTAFQLAKRMDQLGDEALGDEILTTILARAPADARNGLTLVSVRYQAERKNFVQADRLLVKLLEDKKLSQSALLWRWREQIARNTGQTATALACLEKALDREFADLPEIVNLESIRQDYRTILAHYQMIAEAHASLENALTPNPSPGRRGEIMKAFLAKVIRTADRWRLVDPESAEPCQMAGKIFRTVGEREMAWDYWTTPIDLHPSESKPWLDLGETMKTEGDLDRADRAFALAFDAEPTNPEILWRRAQNQVRMGQPERARQLYRQIADGTWQVRFAGTVQQARGLAEE